MKKGFAILMTCCLLLLCACGCAEAPQATEGIVIPEITVSTNFQVPDNEAMEFTRNMRTGWNLGNTFDAEGYLGWFRGGEEKMETAWVNVMTTPELIKAVHDAGFNTLRLPVSWHDHVDKNDVISPVWLHRVHEVADYALDLGMYVIVNIHHDNSEKFLYPDEAHYERSAEYLSAIWTQVAQEFKDEDEHLILESMNEIRLVGTNWEWNYNKYDPTCKEASECVNRLNQLFVDTVRAQGDWNETRYLMVPAYCANAEYACLDTFTLPQDQVENRIIVEAHAYTPYDFALNLNSKDQSFDPTVLAKTSQIGGFMNKLYQKFIMNGIPVVIDEYGALDKGGNLQSRVNFAAYYVASASTRGITCCWWDNCAFSGSGELFGLIDRKTCTWVYPDIALAIDRYCMYGRE